MKQIIAVASFLFISPALIPGAWAVEMDAPAAGEEQPPTRQFQSLVRSYRVLGQVVKGSGGEDLGRITQILLDPESGQAVYVIVTSGGVLGVGEEERLVPWQALIIDAESYEVAMNLTERQFEQAPKGAVISSERQAEEIYRYYGVGPEWRQGEPPATGGERMRSPDQPAGGGMQEQRHR